jgi:hypothetical protein
MYACFDCGNNDGEKMIMGVCCECDGEIVEFDDDGELVEED